MTTEQKQFISNIAKYVQKYASSYDIKVYSPIIAQAILESGWGKSKLSAQYHNYFGLKCGTKWTGKSVNMTTNEEYTVGTITTIKDNFRVYDSMEEGVKGYFEFIQLARYHNLKGITDPRKYLETIKADGYATSSTYVENNMKVVTQYNLTQYDKDNIETTTSKKEVDNMSEFATKNAAIQVVINAAKEEIGYLEKRNNANLDSKTANAGHNNWTKYWADIKPEWQGQPWCACWVSYIFKKCFGLEMAKKLLKHFPYVYCPTMSGLFTLHANPEVGDIVIFKRNGTFVHTGIVVSVNGDYFETIEGNTSSANVIEANGGGVFRKGYYNSSLPGTKFCRPDYSLVVNVKPQTTTTSTKPSTNSPLNKTEEWKGIVTASSLSVRTYAGTNNPECSFSPFKKGKIVSVCDSVKASNGDTWYYVCSEGKYGFCHSDYIEKDTETKVETTDSSVGTVTANTLNVRTWAGTEYGNIKSYPTLKKGDKVKVLSSLSAADGSQWYKICINNSATKNKDIIGFVAAKYIEK